MPTIAARGKTAFQSPIRKLSPYANRAKKQGVEVLHLNIGQPDIPAPIKAIEAIQSYQQDLIEYGPSEGIENYRNGLVQYYEKWNVTVDSEDIIVTTGASEALLLTLFACCDPGDEVIVPEPYYANYNGISAMAGVTLIPIQSAIEDGFPLPDEQQIKNAITSKTKGFLLCNPTNPTGKVYSQEMRELLST